MGGTSFLNLKETSGVSLLMSSESWTDDLEHDANFESWSLGS